MPREVLSIYFDSDDRSVGGNDESNPSVADEMLGKKTIDEIKKEFVELINSRKLVVFRCARSGDKISSEEMRSMVGAIIDKIIAPHFPKHKLVRFHWSEITGEARNFWTKFAKRKRDSEYSVFIPTYDPLDLRNYSGSVHNLSSKLKELDPNFLHCCLVVPDNNHPGIMNRDSEVQAAVIDLT